MLLNDCRMRFLFDEKCCFSIGVDKIRKSFLYSLIFSFEFNFPGK